METLIFLGAPGFLLTLVLVRLFGGSPARAAVLAGLALLVIAAFVFAALRSDASTCHDCFELAGGGYPAIAPVLVYMNGLGSVLGAMAGSALRVRKQRRRPSRKPR